MATATRHDDRVGGMHEKGEQSRNQAKEAAGNAADKAKGMAETVLDKAKNVASGVAETAGNIASTVGTKAEQATEAVGGGMRSLGESIRAHGPGGVLGGATSTVAGALEGAGGYLEQEGLSGIGRDVTNLLRRYPFAALAAGVCMGYMLARVLRS